MITPTYTAIFGILFMLLSIRALRMRRKHKVAIGLSGNKEFVRAVRAHGNFAEYTPLVLLIIYMLENEQVNAIFIHMLCLILLAGRLSHAYGVSQCEENYKFRVRGMAMTFLSLGFACMGIIALKVI